MESCRYRRAGRLIWDTNPGAHVQSRTLSAFAADTDFLHARTVRGAQWDLDVLREVLTEQSRSVYPQFAKRKVVRYFLDYMAGHSIEPPPFNPDELICSTFVDRVIRETLSIEPFPEDAPPLALPGHFARTSAMECMPLATCVYRLEGEPA
jgi:hypothetical protein